MEDIRAGGPAAEPLLLVGRIRKPHGVRGELYVWTETDRPQAVFRPGRELLLGDDSGATPGASLRIERARPFKDGFLVKTLEHTSRTERLEELRGKSLYIPRSEAAPLDEGEVFYHDLIGLQVVARGETVGVVREVYETAGADLLVVRREGREELLIPFVSDALVRIDLEQRLLEVDPPPGLLEL
jgi:16S rRNA processing protein RimM